MNTIENLNTILQTLEPTSELWQTLNNTINDLKADEKKLLIRWSVEDVIEIAKERSDKDLSEKQALEVLKLVERRHDCNIGVNWDVLEIYVDDLF